MNFDCCIAESSHIRRHSMVSESKTPSPSIFFCAQSIIISLELSCFSPQMPIPILSKLFHFAGLRLNLTFSQESFSSVQLYQPTMLHSLNYSNTAFWKTPSDCLGHSPSQFNVWISPTFPTVLLIHFDSFIPRVWHVVRTFSFYNFRLHLLFLMDVVKSSLILDIFSS